MTFVITEPCLDTGDLFCVEVCPVNCIHYNEGADRMLYIDPVTCLDCGRCAPVCPVSAIFPAAEVPADQQRFVEINALWYQDKAAAREQVGGDAATAPARKRSEGGVVPRPRPAALPLAAVAGAPAETSVPIEHPLTPIALVALAVFAAAWYAMVNYPGPRWFHLGFLEFHIGPWTPSGNIGATVVVLIPVLIIAFIVFARHETGMLARFNARQPRRPDPWRSANWGQLERNEESRRHYQALAVQEIAAQRFRFPNDDAPHFHTYVNVPERQLAVEVGPEHDHLFPDIVVTRTPGNYPAMVVMVETRETVTREQARQVWKRLENGAAPLYLYVPSGLAGEADDLARDAGVHNYLIRTWRHVPGTGIVVREA